MKTILLLCFFALLSSTEINAQNRYNCATSEIHLEKMKTDEIYAKKYTESDAAIYRRSVNFYKNPSETIDDTHIIPVVVHVVHKETDPLGTGSNIADQQVFDAIQYLNDSFSDTNGSVDTGIEFCLASVDTSGNPTNGITRLASTELSELCTSESNTMKTLRHWDQTSYMNIWVVGNIYISADIDDLCNDPIAGFANSAFLHGQTSDGIVVSDNYLLQSTLPHEVGHYLNLKHTFQGSCTNDDCLADGDRICDTPPDGSTFYVGCVTQVNSCSSDVNPNDPNNPFTTDQNDLTDNFMDYNTKVCRIKFTEGQKVRMVDALNNERISLKYSNACCLSDKIASGDVYNDLYYEVGNSIITTEALQGSINAVYNAGGFIEMLPGFNSGEAEVLAIIDGCSNPYDVEAKISDNHFNEISQINQSNKTSDTNNDKLIQETISNYPNPFNNSTMINFNLNKASNVSLKVFDASGREISRLMDKEQKEAGNFQIKFDANDLTSGIYFYTLQTNTNSITKKMILHK